VSGTITLPRKTREIHNHYLESTVWNDFAFRDGDIVIATYPKAGTTWSQQIVGQLIFGGDPQLDIDLRCPWLDMRLDIPEKLDRLAAQTHRRFIKTHLPADALVISPLARYVYVARDGRDVLWSLYNHHRNYIPQWYVMINNPPGLEGPRFEPPPDDIRQYWHDWLDRDGYPFWSFWESVRTWWAMRNLPNVLLVHFANLKRDMPGEIRRIAAFLEVEVDDSRRDAIHEYCSFDWMKANAEQVAPRHGSAWEGGAQTFIHQGVNGRWTDTLTPAEAAEYEARAIGELGGECAHWLKTGELS
jgi:aryl sulfotransferase